MPMAARKSDWAITQVMWLRFMGRNESLRGCSSESRGREGWWVEEVGLIQTCNINGVLARHILLDPAHGFLCANIGAMGESYRRKPNTNP